MIDNQSYMPVQSGERETRRVLVIHIDKHTANGQTIPYTIQLPQKAEDAVDVSLTNLPQISIGTGDYLQVDIDKIYEVYESGFVLETSGEMVQVTRSKFCIFKCRGSICRRSRNFGYIKTYRKGCI